MNFIKTENIPIWVTLLAIIFALSGIGLGVMGMLELVPDQPQITPYLGGRSMGIGVVFGIAVWFKSPIAYMAAFIAGATRELGDVMGEIAKTEVNMVTVFAELGFAAVCLLAAFYAFKAIKK